MPYSINRNIFSGHLPVLIGGCGGSDYRICIDIRRDGFCVCSSPPSAHVHTDVHQGYIVEASLLSCGFVEGDIADILQGIVCVCVFCGNSVYLSVGLYTLGRINVPTKCSWQIVVVI